jgi:hypothetical protein
MEVFSSEPRRLVCRIDRRKGEQPRSRYPSPGSVAAKTRTARGHDDLADWRSARLSGGGRGL